MAGCVPKAAADKVAACDTKCEPPKPRELVQGKSNYISIKKNTKILVGNPQISIKNLQIQIKIHKFP